MTSQLGYFLSALGILVLVSFTILYVRMKRSNNQSESNQPDSLRNNSLLHLLKVFIQVCAALNAAAGLTALLGWMLRLPYLSSFDESGVPMAPSTALLFVLFAVAIFLRVRLPSSRAAQRTGAVLSGVGGLAALALFFLSSRGVYLDFEHIGVAIPHVAGQAIIGHMSPITAVGFVIAALSYLSLLYSIERSKPVNLSWWLAGTLAVAGFLLLLAYWIGVPILYSGSFIPPAALTSIGFIILGIGLMGLAAVQIWLSRNNDISDSSIRAGIGYALIFIILIAIIITNGYLAYQKYEEQYRAQVESQISGIAKLKVDELGDWRAGKLTDAQVLYENPILPALIRRYFENPADDEARAQLQTWLENYHIYEEYDRVRLVDIQGVTHLSYPADLPPLPVTVIESIPEVVNSGQVQMVDFYRREGDGHINLNILIPIVDESAGRQVIGLITLSIDPDVYLFPFIQSWPVPSESAETLLIRKDGDGAMYLNPLRFASNAALNLNFPLELTQLPSVQAVLGVEGIVEGIDYHGELVIAYIRKVPNSPWYLISKMDIDEVYVPLKTRLWQTFLVIGMAIFVAGAGLTTVWRQQRVQYYRLQAEMATALQTSEEKFRLAFDTSPDSITITRLADGVFVSVNKGFEMITGYTREQVIGKSSTEINLWKDPEDRKNVIEELIVRGFVKNYEARFHTLDGEIYGLSSAVVIELSGVQHVLNITRDISERRRAEQKIQESKSNLSSLIENTDGSIWAVDREYQLIVGNREFHHNVSAALGRQLEMKESALHPNFPPEVNAQWQGYYDRVLAGESFIIETQTRFQESPHYIEYRFSPIRDGSGEIHGVTVYGRDITERKLAYEQLLKTLEELKRSNTELEQFAYVASHDLQEPLRAVAGMVQLLQKRYRGHLDERADEYISLAMDGATRMQTLINDLLTYSRVERRGNPFQAVNTNKSLASAIRNLQASVAENRATITFENLPIVDADETQITQLFQNLIGNAIKFHGEDPIQIHIGSAKIAEAWQFSVKDNGIGIDPQYFERVFLVFQRLHTRREYPGTGIGLSICKKIVERHGGRIWIESQPGQGTTFHFTIPVRS